VSIVVDIGAYYYVWYNEAQWKKFRSVHTPLREFYDSSDSEVISQHIDWARKFGIKFLLVSWDGPEEEGKIADRNLKNAFLTNPLSHDVQFAILYESEARLKENPSDIMNLGDPRKADRLVADFDYLALNYFKDPRYYRVNGKPLVVLYLSRDYKHTINEVGGAISRLRRNELYIVGDEVYWHTLARNRFRPWKTPTLGVREAFIRLYNGVTAYNMHEEPNVADMKNFDTDFDTRVEKEYGDWLKALPNAVDFIPNVIPGFNDTKIRGHTPLQHSVTRFDRQLQLALRHVSKANVLLITSFNEWHEDTQIEPAKDYEPPAGSLGYLDTLKRRLV
jgi:glycoprotein endo-alpha-1,2-mannosidase